MNRIESIALPSNYSNIIEPQSQSRAEKQNIAKNIRKHINDQKAISINHIILILLVMEAVIPFILLFFIQDNGYRTLAILIYSLVTCLFMITVLSSLKNEINDIAEGATKRIYISDLNEIRENMENISDANAILKTTSQSPIIISDIINKISFELRLSNISIDEAMEAIGENKTNVSDPLKNANKKIKQISDQLNNLSNMLQIETKSSTGFSPIISTMRGIDMSNIEPRLIIDGFDPNHQAHGNSTAATVLIATALNILSETDADYYEALIRESRENAGYAHIILSCNKQLDLDRLRKRIDQLLAYISVYGETGFESEIKGTRKGTSIYFSFNTMTNNFALLREK